MEITPKEAIESVQIPLRKIMIQKQNYDKRNFVITTK
jgi:hypothetical protein